MRRALCVGLGGVLLFSIACKRKPAPPPVVSAPPPVSVPQTPAPPAKPPATNQVPPGQAARAAEKVVSAPTPPPTVTEIPRLIRVGLATGVRSARISSPGRMTVVFLADPTHAHAVSDGEVTLSLDSMRAASAALGRPHGALRRDPTVFRIQVGSFQEERRAQLFKADLEKQLGEPVVVEPNGPTATYRVRAGACATRVEAEALGERLQEAGFLNGWIVKEDNSRDVEPSSRATLGSGTPPVARLFDERNIELARMPLSAAAPEPVGLVRITTQDSESFLTYDHLAYRGSIEVLENTRGQLTVVNALDLDDYLKGVVPNEMPPGKFDALEALKAQAVAARTYALRSHARFAREGYDICATVACQIYRGVSSERPLSSQAVEATRGIVIEYHGRLIDALYTSTCGGRTEDAKNIFRTMDAPYLRSAFCPPENARPIDPRLVAVSGYHLHWKVQVTRRELQNTIRKALPLDTLVDVEPLQYGASRRVIELRIVGRTRDFVVRGLEVKSVLGLKDSLFTLTRERDRHGQIVAFDFDGRGWGHGVGLCQTGAFGLALQGEDYISILKTYYYDVDVVRENIRED